MQIDYQYVAPRALTRYARGVPDLPQHILQRFLPDQMVGNIEVRMDRLTRANRAARFRAFDAETEIGKRPVVDRRSVKLPPVGEKRVVGEWESLAMQMLQGSNPGIVGEAAFEDTTDNVLAIRRRMELARGDVLVDGKVTIVDEGGLKGLEADYGLPAGQNTTPSTAWSDHTNATVLDDLRAWSDAVAAASGDRPAFALTSGTVLTHMRRNLQVREAVGALGGTPASVTPAQLQAVLESEMLPTPVVDDAQVTDWAGTATRVIPVDRVILLPASPIGYTAWGITAEALTLVQAGQLDLGEASGIAAYCMTEGDPVRLWTKGTAVAMPVIEDARRMLSADVV